MFHAFFCLLINCKGVSHISVRQVINISTTICQYGHGQASVSKAGRHPEQMGAKNMSVKMNIRKRRNEKIKHIMEKGTGTDRFSMGERREVHVDDRVPVENASGSDPRMEDPEYVWKLRQKRMDWQFDPYERGRVEEEKGWSEWMASPTRNQLGFKLVACALLFILVWGAFHTNQAWTQPVRSFVTDAMTKDMDYQKAAAWYKTVFKGSPSFLPAFKMHFPQGVFSSRPDFVTPAKGVAVSKTNDTLKGIWLRTSSQSPVKAAAEGRVIYVGKQNETGLTLWIQHPGQWISEYGMLGQTDLQLDDWVKGGQTIAYASALGEGNEANFYFALMKDKQYMKPTGVISFD